MNGSIELTLCGRCASVYYDMPDRCIKRKDMKQTVKECCDICQTGRGYEYVVNEIQDIKRGGGYGKR